jgi:hypothetical protein
MGHIEFAPLFLPIFSGKTAANTARKVKLRLKLFRVPPIRYCGRERSKKLLPRNMEIEFNPGLNANAGTSQPLARRENTQPVDTTMPFERTDALEKISKETPHVRPEMVARASALVADANYPSNELLNKVAGALAGNINRQPA